MHFHALRQLVVDHAGFLTYFVMSTNKKDQTGVSCTLSQAQRNLLDTVSGIDAIGYEIAIRGLFRQTAMHAPITEEVQAWLIDADALANYLEALALESEPEAES